MKTFVKDLQEKQAREKAEAELEERRIATPTMNTVYMIQCEVDSLKEEVACLRSVLSEVHEPDGFDHYSQWHRANELADKRKAHGP